MIGGLLQGSVGCTPRCSGIEAAWTCNRCLDADDVNQSNMDHTCNMQGKIHSVGCNNVNSEFDNFVEGCNANLGKVYGMTQVKFRCIWDSLLMIIFNH